MFSEHSKVSSVMAARYETCPVTGDCSYCFPHGFETRNRHETWRIRAKVKSKWERSRRQARQYKEWTRYFNQEKTLSKVEIMYSVRLKGDDDDHIFCKEHLIARKDQFPESQYVVKDMVTTWPCEDCTGITHESFMQMAAGF
jgi:hypothetical protein